MPWYCVCIPPTIIVLMDKKIKDITITQFDYVIRNINDEEVDIQGHPHYFSEVDREGRILKEIKYNREGEFEEMIGYAYDPQGLLIEESYYPLENELAEVKKIERNEAGQILRTFKHYQDGSVDTTVFEYDGDRKSTRLNSSH